MKILAIETSADDTGVAILECKGDAASPSFDVLGSRVFSQVTEHRKHGGIYPNLAKRLHSQNLIPLLKKTLSMASVLHNKKTSQNYSNVRTNIRIVLEREPELLEQFSEYIPTIKKPDIDAIAVTYGPGLEPALWVGINFAKALSLVWDIPLIPVNHMEGHIASVFYKNDQQIKFPALALLISGGHTQLVLAKKWENYELLGETRDDAVGEAFDKVARMLGLPYPGGPEISRLADRARQAKLPQKSLNNPNPNKIYSTILQNCGIDDFHTIGTLPRPMINSNNYDFSFSGLKTAVLYKVKKLSELTNEIKQEIAMEFEDAVTDVLISKTRKALREYHPKTLIVAGGVIANTHLRDSFGKLTGKFPETELRIPHPDVTGDNAIMIGITGYLNTLTQKGHTDVGLQADVRAKGSLALDGLA